MNKHVAIDFSRCNPLECDQTQGLCRAATACSHHLLEQEEEGETPMLISASFCVGCSLCVAACPLGAIQQARE